MLLVMTDQHRADALGADGNRVISTPHLDRLAREGVRCAHAYVQNPICMPSRATIFTGRYPRSHRVWTNGVCLPADEITLADMLGSAGYRTAAFGKLHFTPTDGPGGPERWEARSTWNDPAMSEAAAEWEGPYYGFQTVRLATGHNYPGAHYGRWLRRHHPEALALMRPEAAVRPRSGAHQSWKSALPEEAHASTWIADETIAFLRAQAGGNQEGEARQPFFAVCSFPDPHHPFCPPLPWAEQYDPAEVPMPVRREGELDDLPPHFAQHFAGAWARRGLHAPEHPEGLPEAHLREIIAHYYGMISLVDKNVGRVLQALDDLGIAKETLVIFTADHGELLGDHGLLLKGPFLYEGLVRIPLLWRQPGTIAASQVLDGLVGHVDLVPTVLELLGMSTPLGVQGQSLAAALRVGNGPDGAGGSGSSAQRRPWVLTEYRKGFSPDLSLKQLHNPRYKLTYYGHEQFGELFDLQEDPHELVNRFGDPAYGGVRRELERQLLDVLMATEDPLPPQIAFA